MTVRSFSSGAVTGPDYHLGEGVRWNPATASVLWVDITRGAVYSARLDGERLGAISTSEFGGTVGAAVPALDGGLLVAGDRGLLSVDPAGAVTSRIPLVDAARASRLNDGAVDPAGRFLVGTLSLGQTSGDEQLFSIDPNGTVTVLRDDLSLSNGIAWSPTGDRLYVVDSLPGRIWGADYDVATGAVGNWTTLFVIDDGLPDGLTVDSAGFLWLAIWGRGEIRCYSPEGELTAAVAVDAPHTSSMAFCGPNLDRLVITTARKDLSAGDLVDHPLSGAVFVATVDAIGLEPTPWAGRTVTRVGTDA